MNPSRHLRLLAAATVLLPACAPMVTHGPRVEPGLQMVATAGIFRSLCDTGCSTEQWPAVGGGLRYGWAPARTDLPAVHGALFLPVGDVAAPELDLYVQGPGRGGSWAYGVGALSSPRHLMPYAQVGRTPIGGPGWYATAGYARLSRYDAWFDVDQDSVPEHAMPPRFWTPSVALRLPREAGTMDIYLSAALGHYVDNVVTYGPYDPATQRQELFVEPVRRPIRTLTAGVVLSADLNSFSRGPWGRPRPGVAARR